jgi:hypothetical protein
MAGGDRIPDRKQGTKQPISAQSYHFSGPVAWPQVFQNKQLAVTTIERPFTVFLPENP